MTKKPRQRHKRLDDKIYFTKETEDAIIKYNLSTDPEERDRIYREYIEYPFDKLAENIINRFKFPYVNQPFEDIKKQVVSFLVINLSKYTEGKGKAFSYFSVIAKNYLILHNNNGYKQEKRAIYLSDKNDSEVQMEDILQLEHPSYEEREEAREFIHLMVEYWDIALSDEELIKSKDNFFKKKRNKDIANAVIELFRRVDTIENFNKKALYLMVREMTNCKTSYITKVVNKMKERVLNHMKEYNQYGVIGVHEAK